MRAAKEEAPMSGNLTAMIDVVFQLIIFFVVTTNMQNTIDQRIKLAIAPHGQSISDKPKDPREIKIDLDEKGNIYIAKSSLTPSILTSIVRKAVSEYGVDVPIVIRADGNAQHSAVQTTMNAVTASGIYKIKFAVLKESGSKGKEKGK